MSWSLDENGMRVWKLEHHLHTSHAPYNSLNDKNVCRNKPNIVGLEQARSQPYGSGRATSFPGAASEFITFTPKL